MNGQKELLSFIELAAQLLSDRSEDVTIEFVCSEHMLSVMIACHPSDLSKLIGKQGRNIGALRALAQAIASKYRTKITVALRE